MTNDIDAFQLELGQGSEIAMALALALMMFSVALGLRVEHFRFMRTSPRVFLAGVVAQILLLPVLTIGLCYLISPLPSVALGMILVACCPGGNVSNILVLLARGNAALSVSLTATSSIASAFVTPISIVFWSSMYAPTAELLTEIQFDVISFLLQTGAVLGLPLFAGMACATLFPQLSNRLRKPLVAISTLTLILIIVFAWVKFAATFYALGLGLIWLVALHNGTAFAAGNIVGRLIGAGAAERRALTFEVGIQNAGLGIVILLTQLAGLGGAAAVAGLWGTWHILAGLVLVMLFRLSDRPSTEV